eukprot:472151-Pleurochrysis_carterae.AAC.3
MAMMSEQTVYSKENEDGRNSKGEEDTFEAGWGQVGGSEMATIADEIEFHDVAQAQRLVSRFRPGVRRRLSRMKAILSVFSLSRSICYERVIESSSPFAVFEEPDCVQPSASLAKRVQVRQQLGSRHDHANRGEQVRVCDARARKSSAIAAP